MAIFVLGFVAIFGYCFCASVEVNQCVTNLDDVIAQTNFDIKQFAGAWYTHSGTTYMYGDDTWDSMTNIIYVHEDESITRVVSGHPKNTDKCMIHPRIMTEDDTAEYSGALMQGTMKYKVMYTDYSSAAMFFCFDVQADGTCAHEKEQIEIWSRSIDDMTTDTMNNLLSYFRGIKCTDVKDMKVMVQGHCETPSSTEPDKPGGGCYFSPNERHVTLAKERPSGDFYTMYVAVTEGEEAVMSAYKFTVSQNDNIVYVTSSHRRVNSCSEIELGKYFRISEGHYLQIGSSIPREIWIAEIERSIIGLFICYERKGGKCTKSRVQRLVQQNQPINLDVLKKTEGRLVAHFCTKYDIYVGQNAGLCRVPDLINSIISFSDTLLYTKESIHHHTTSRLARMQIGSCQLSSIPVEESLQLSQLSGLWYELVRPMNVANQFESAVVYFQFQEDGTLHGAYSGAINNKCSPAISSHTKHLKGSVHDAEMMAKLHGPDEVFIWMHYKIVYYDGTYSVHYGCFGTDDNGNCKHAEASLYGRKRTIDEATRERILSLFPLLCLSTDFLQDTVHNVDCSDWVIPQTDHRINPGYCNVQDIPAQKVVSLKQMAGSWYVIAGTNPILRRFDLSLHEDILITEGFGRKDGECTLLFTHTGTSVLHKNNGELLISFQNQEYRGYFTGKVIYTDYQVAVLYLCEDETIHGECLEYRVSILSRTQTLDSMGRSLLEAKLKLPCGDLSSNLTQITVIVLDHCEKEQSCRIDDIQAVENLDIRKILGIWYIIKNTNKLNTSDSSALKFNLDEDGHIHLKFTTLQSDGTCVQPPYYSYMKRRNDPGDFLSTTLSKYSKPGFLTGKVIYTDYQVAVLYLCEDETIHGECLEYRVSILSRTQTLDSMGRSLLEAKLKLSCGDLSSNLTQITDHCEKEQSCRIDDIQAVENLDIRKILGIWYIIKNTNKLNTSDSSALKFNLDEDGHIHLKFTTLQSDGTCVQPPYYSYMKRRNDPGDFLSTTLSKYSKPGFHPFKILFTDYENTMVTYICIDIQANGQCGEKGKRLSILSRTQSITQETKTGFLRFVDLACVNRNDIIEVKHEVDCSSAL
ncbi:unnamed protein product [Mytilus coruscus]|uniref:Lipocalin/cytosolic fatty-acid binding domain-containing protein n=1 Tax=Mytilus coruscus TaxID=42192 RepID=A0A6J8EBX7_MYTCO|nr:unnamed protein product [Mytilus coruscus]